MYLVSLSITGFKSFAKKSELTFDAPITAIVGPNGSGKSNVAESFRFVLGEQSVKSMRGRKGEDLIWGGSESVARGNRASVKVILNNESRVFSLDFDEVSIERIVHRDGQNEYAINGSTVRLRDVQELLASANVGASGHHIISQGEADRVLTANPRERREMIEDALGLKAFQFKKQEAEKKLQKTKTNMEQVESLRREHAPHLKYLEKQIKQIEKSVEVQRLLNTTYLEYLKREDVYIAYHHDRLNTERLEPASRLEVLAEEITTLKAQTTEQPTPVESSAVKKARAQFEEIRSSRIAIEKQKGQLEGKIQFLKERITEVTKSESVTVERSQLESTLDTIDHAYAEVETSEDVGQLRASLGVIIDSVRTLRTLLEDSELDTTERDTSTLDALEAEYTELQSKVSDLEAKEATSVKMLEEAEASVRAELQEQQVADRHLFTLMNERRDLEHVLERIDRELSVLDRDRIEFKRELQEAVTLLGRDAARYFEYQVVHDDTSVTNEQIVGEEREHQRERRRALEKLKIRLEELGVGSTEAVEAEYKTAKERDDFLENELADLGASITNLEQLITELTEQFNEEFKKGVEHINIEFGKFFVLMFGGGSASLKEVTETTKEDENGEDSVSKVRGVELAVHLPNKRVRGLDMLSGGERALSSIALIFAMSQVNPPPFIILDETDAALDEANSRRYGDMIEALSKKSQLILITHNRETMSRADILYGVTMGADGVSKLLSVKFDEALAVAK